MAVNTNLAPTKTNLLKIKQDLQFATIGYELLDQKRNILVLELLRLVDQTIDHEQRVYTAMMDAHKMLSEATLKMGRLSIAQLGSAVNIESSIQLKQRKIMGVPLPVVETSFVEHSPYFNLTQTSFWVDNAIKLFKDALKLIGRLAELKISLMRLAQEVKKTIRKVNALEKIAIPELKKVLHSIHNRLEENERDMFVLMKTVKTRLEKTNQ